MLLRTGVDPQLNSTAMAETLVVAREVEVSLAPKAVAIAQIVGTVVCAAALGRTAQ